MSGICYNLDHNKKQIPITLGRRMEDAEREMVISDYVGDFGFPVGFRLFQNLIRGNRKQKMIPAVSLFGYCLRKAGRVLLP